MKPNSTPTTRRQLCALAVALLTAAQTAPVAAADAVNADGATSWVALCEGAIVLFRHAMAPGIGDPPNFKLGDCRHGQMPERCPRRVSGPGRHAQFAAVADSGHSITRDLNG